MASAATRALWTNWQSAVETGRTGVQTDSASRAERMRSFSELSSGAADQAAVISRIVQHEARGVRATMERYGRWNTDNFQVLKMLGEGAFGTVTLCRRKGTDELYALKQMDKSRYQQKNHIQRAFTERDALAEARSRWCVELFATFQDEKYVYMVMEFVQGGDLIGQLQRKGRFSHEETAFYMAELVEALDTVHRCGFVHRDVKPDNVVIAMTGHLKLLDFGLCKNNNAPAASGGDDFPQPREPARGDPDGGPRNPSIVGTPQYMAPEGFSGSYGPESDLWAVGVIAFECLAGVVPFHAGRLEGREAIRLIRDKIMQHVDVLPERLRKTRRHGWTTPTSEQFLSRVIAPREQRLSAEQMRREPFFSGIDFGRLHQSRPPFVPRVTSPEDTSLFEQFRRTVVLPRPGSRMSWDRSLEWAHYGIDGRALSAQKVPRHLFGGDSDDGGAPLAEV